MRVSISARRTARDRMDFIQVNALRAVGVAYHNLKLEEDALRRAEEAEQHRVTKRLPTFWLPHVYRNQLNALAGTSRFSMRAAQKIANRAHDACNATSTGDGDLLHFLIARSLANAFVAHDNIRESMPLFDRLAAQLDGVHRIGILHRVMFMRSAAMAHVKANDTAGVEYWRVQGIALAKAAGLHNQLAQLRAMTPNH